MKLLEAGAVLLIIGAAVIGPIKMGVDANRSDRGCVRPGEPNEFGRLECVLESIVETCTRALHETGSDLGAIAFTTRNDGSFFEAFDFKRTNPERRCIPAPSGLK